MKIIVAVILFFISLKAQASDSLFSKVYIRVATELTHTDPEMALHVADSLFQHSPEQKQKLSALMLTANVYYRTGNLKEAFNYAQRADRIAKDLKDYDWQIRIHGFYSTIYRDVRFINEGLMHLEQVELLLPKIKESGKKNVIKLLNIQSKAYFHLLNRDFDAVINELNQGIPLYADLKLSSVGPYHIANSEEFRGRVYLYKNEFQQSAEAYRNAIESLQKFGIADTYPVFGYIYAGIGKLRIEEENYQEAKEYFNKAEKIVQINKSTDLELFYKKYLSAYYAALEDWENYAVTADSIKYLENKTEREVDALLMNLFGEIRKESDSYSSKAAYYEAIIYIALAILLVLLILAYKRKKRHRLEVEEILAKIDSLKVANPILSTPKTNGIEGKDTKSGMNISEETLERIKQGLVDFEKEEIYLDPSIGATSIASYCQTNVRYISEVINTYKNESVSAYINRLRVTYILAKLRDEKIYRNYKISHLADEAGFSNHSKFSAEFKRIVGIAPSIFISRMS